MSFQGRSAAQAVRGRGIPPSAAPMGGDGCWAGFYKLLLKLHQQKRRSSAEGGRACQSHAAVLEKGLDVLLVPGGRGRRTPADGRHTQSVSRFVGGARRVGGAGVGSAHPVLLGDENGHEESNDDRARTKEEGRARDERLLVHRHGRCDLQLCECAHARVRE